MPGRGARKSADTPPPPAAMPPDPVSLASTASRCVWLSLAAGACCSCPAADGSVFLSLSHRAQ